MDSQLLEMPPCLAAHSLRALYGELFEAAHAGDRGRFEATLNVAQLVGRDPTLKLERGDPCGILLTAGAAVLARCFDLARTSIFLTETAGRVFVAVPRRKK